MARRRRQQREKRREQHLAKAPAPAIPEQVAAPTECRPSDYGIRHLEDLQPGTLVWLWVRVSSQQQAANGKLKQREQELRDAVASKGGIVVGVTSCVARACDATAELEEAIRCAKEAGAVLLARDTARFARHPDHTAKAKLPPRAEDLDNLRRLSDGVILMTVIEPDTLPGKDEAQSGPSAQAQTGKWGGRKAKAKRGPYKRNYKKAYAIDKLVWMRRLGILEKKAIARLFGKSPSTVRGWVEQWEKLSGQRWRDGGK